MSINPPYDLEDILKWASEEVSIEEIRNRAMKELVTLMFKCCTMQNRERILEAIKNLSKVTEEAA